MKTLTHTGVTTGTLGSWDAVSGGRLLRSLWWPGLTGSQMHMWRTLKSPNDYKWKIGEVIETLDYSQYGEKGETREHKRGEASKHKEERQHPL